MVPKKGIKKTTKKRTNPKQKKVQNPKSNKIPSRLAIFAFGLTCGLLLHFVPALDGVTSELTSKVKYPLKEYCQTSANNFPYANPILSREGYTVAYDGRAKTALWVYEELTSDSVTGNVDRTHFNFINDPDIPSIIQPDSSDYKCTGFDRGHLAPAADHRISQTAMQETFYFSNICPQDPQFNRGYWLKLEKNVRDLARTYGKVQVITGPLYLSHEEDGKRYVKYQVIGKNEVAVPTHFFKVVTVGEGNSKIQNAYILPNEPIDPSTSLDSFRCIANLLV